MAGRWRCATRSWPLTPICWPTSCPRTELDQPRRLLCLSLNHIQGCPLDCAYCIRHTYDLWDHRAPRALMPDAEAVEQLVAHRYFRAHVTPLQIFNRATDPFLPIVRPHTLAVLRDLDGRGLRNHVLVITRHQMKPSDIGALEQLANIKLTLLFTYSGIDTLKLAKRLLPGQASYKLGALASAFSLADGLPAGLSPHRATYDALVTSRLFLRLATRDDSAITQLQRLHGDDPGYHSDAPFLF